MFIFAPCLVCSVGSTHTGPQRCVTLMIPYWSSLLKWHHHHYHSISRPLIGQAGDNPALSLADSKLWSNWHCKSRAGASLTHVFAPSQSTYYWARISHLCPTSDAGGKNLIQQIFWIYESFNKPKNIQCYILWYRVVSPHFWFIQCWYAAAHPAVRSLTRAITCHISHRSPLLLQNYQTLSSQSLSGHC